MMSTASVTTVSSSIKCWLADRWKQTKSFWSWSVNGSRRDSSSSFFPTSNQTIVKNVYCPSDASSTKSFSKAPPSPWLDIDLGILIQLAISTIAIDSKHRITRRTRFLGSILTPRNWKTTIGITWITTSARAAIGILPSPSHSSTGVCAFAFYRLTTHLSVKEFSSMQLVMGSRFPY